MATELRLLLIEDCEEDAELVIHALTRSGYRVDAERVDTPEDFVSALDRRAWDLAIADFTMPRFSGAAALKMMRERDADTPFIFVSGTIGEDAAVVSMKSGANDYIMKGNLKRLAPAVERELRESAIRQERKRADERLAHLTFHDPLTDLPNRVLLRDRLEQAVHIAHHEHRPLTVLVMNLNGFREINETLGYHVGDRVLQQVASRVRSVTSEADTVARLGADEFALILPSADADAAVRTARAVLRGIDGSLDVDGASVAVLASIGIAQYPEHGLDGETLLQKATTAMEFAKSDASGWAVYAPERNRQINRRVAFTTEFAQALELGRLSVEYQPIVALRTGTVEAVEALVRWEHPTAGRLMPGDFIGQAEQTGLVTPMTTFVLERALGDWRDGGPSTSPASPSISVNLSPRSLHDQDLPDRVADLLRAHSRPASTLIFEITETAIMSDPARSLACLVKLHDMGVRLAIDDFGTGYSSLSYLRRLPVQELKIDKSFIIGLASGEDDAIVRSTIALAHNLGLAVVAEGVESAEVQAMLVDLGCDSVQGHAIMGSVSAVQLRGWIARRDMR
jgi:diguanylate cyclase (GGDEF)-like protein